METPRWGLGSDVEGSTPGEKPRPVLGGVMLVDDACGTQVLVSLDTL